MVKKVAVECQIARGAFSKERVFTVDLPDGSQHVGAAYVGYFLTKKGQKLDESEPAPDKPVPGKVVARVVGEKGDEVTISVPDGEVITVRAGQLSGIKEDSPDVFVES